jgi:hypothetical protein
MARSRLPGRNPGRPGSAVSHQRRIPLVTRLTRFWLVCATLGFVVAVALCLIVAAVLDGRV